MTTRPPAWAVAMVVAATYVYFLIFAEFAFIELLGAADPGGVRLVMGVLAAGGIAGSLVAAWRFQPARLGAALQLGFGLCGVGAAAATVVPAGGMGAVALVVGGGLSWLTVTLAAGLGGLLDERRMGRWIGAGTGLAYAICNLPPVFAVTAATQTWLAVAACVAGIGLTHGWTTESRAPARAAIISRRAPGWWLLMLLVLVWLDSAAFYVIQHAAELREHTWTGGVRLWGNAAVHLAAALLAGWAVDRGRMARVLPVAFGLLVLACWRLEHGWFDGSGWCYTTAVSLYSVVLVAYPAQSGRPWLAAAVYALAGWAGSALGIGMVQDLHAIPEWFLIVAAAGFGLAWLGQGRGARALALMVMLAVAVNPGRAGDEDPVVRGREVYIAEGCMHCHSQYVRPGTPDVERWGPAATLAEARAGEPPLLGNRRQGPDLSNVGLRRSAEWNRLHLISPQAVSPGSRMPAYGHLFRGGDSRGDDLVAYLASLGADRADAARRQQQDWRPAAVAPRPPQEQARLFQQLCAACHGPSGRGDGPLAARLSVPPPDFSRGWRRLAADSPDLAERLARLIKHGISGTPMAGHEYLSDRDVLSLAACVETLHNATDP